MKLFFDSYSFDWDEGNLSKNLTKHNVSNQEAENAFLQKPQFVYPDVEHSSPKENRMLLLGKTVHGRKLSIVFTLKENKIRIISARDMSRKERRIYEEAIKSSSSL